MSAGLDVDIQSLWEQLTATQFDPQRFVAEILDDCGLDGRDIRASQVLELLAGNECENFKDVLWAFGEVMHYYAAEPIDDPRKYVRAVFVALILIHGVERGETKWALHFEPVCKFFCSASAACDTYNRGELLRRVMCQHIHPRQEQPIEPQADGSGGAEAGN